MGKRWKRLTAFLLVAILLITNMISAMAAPETDTKESTQYILSVEATEGGYVEISGEGVEKSENETYVVNAGSEVALAVHPEEGYETKNVMLNENSVSELFLMPDKDSLLLITFAEKQEDVEERKQPETEQVVIETPTVVDETMTEEPDAGKPLDEAEKKEKTTSEEEKVEAEQTAGDAISPGCEYTGDVPSIQMQDTLLGDTQKTIYNPGGANVTDVLGVRRENLLDWLGQHVNDDYYLGTPYYPYDWRSPNGDPSFNGSPGMNCTGFVWHALRMAGANDSTPALSGWVSMLVNNGMQYVTYTGSNWNDVSGSVALDGICEPGDIIWTWDMTKGPLQNGVSYYTSDKHHISFFIGTYFDDVKTPGSPYWQDGEVFDRIWHSSDDNAAGAEGIGNVATWMVPKEWTGPYAITVLKMNEMIKTGTLALSKTSANPELTDNNECYSLEGAVYGVYKDQACTNKVAELRTNAAGVSNTIEVNAGNYFVKEITAPKGFALDTKVYPVTVTADQKTQLDVKDLPQSDPVSVLLGKIDAETSQNMPQGSASLENAEFTIKYYGVLSDTDPAEQGISPVRSWVLKTRSDGKTAMTDSLKVSGDDFFKNSKGYNILPLGTITIQETKAPQGYLLNPEVFVRKITPTGDAEGVETYNMPTIPETPQKGVIRLEKKSSEADYGTATLAGAVYEVRNSENSVVDTLTTDGAGKAQSKELPLGRYTVKEKISPAGFLIDPTTYTVDLTADNKTDRVFYKTVTSTEVAQRGIIQIQKKSSEADYGTSSLKGAEYSVYKNKECTNKVDILTTDNAGKAQSKELPWGTYYVKETKNPVGFLIDPNVYTVDLTTDNKIDRVFYKSVTSTEVPQKGIIELQKLDSETDKNEPQGAGSLKDAEYDIFLKSAYQAGDNTTAKSYKGTLTTDQNGKAKSKELPLETYYVIERQPSNGYLVDPTIHEVTLTSDNRTDRVFTKKVTSEEDIIRGNVEIIKLKEIEDEDEDTFEGLEGVEFTFTSDTTGKVVKKIVTDKYGFATTVDKDNPRGGLIFDTYTVTETKCPEGLKPIEPFKVTIKDEGVTLKGIYKEDKLIVSPVSVVKIDESTGKVIPVADTEFRLLDENKKPITMTTYYPNKVEHKTFKTDENGQFTFPDKLTYGTYYLEEINAPEGYLKGELLEFKVTEGATWEKPLVVKYADENAMGQITVTKTSLDKKEKLAGAVFEIRAAEDIITPDGTVRMKKGDLAESVTTGKDGTATSKKLFLGKYDVKETRQPQGFILNEKTYPVELKYKDQVTEIVTEELSVTNKPTEIEILKVDKDTEKPLEGVTFKIWNKAMLPENETDQDAGDNLQDNMGVFTEEDKVDPDAAVISEHKTDADGKINLQYFTPGTYCIQEKETIDGYVLNDEIYEITIAKDGKVDGEEIGKVIVKNEITKIDLSKHDLSSGKEIEGGKYQVLDEDGKVIDEWKGTKEPHRIQGLTVGETYTFKEILAPEGYLLAQDVEFTIESTGEVKKVKMYDELAMGRIAIRKTDSETGDKISGADFKVTAAEDIVTPDGTVRMKKGNIADYIRTEEGVAKTQPLFLGKYEVRERRTAPGYILSEKIYHVELKYKDQETAVVTEELSITNKPNQIEILKVDKDTEKPLEGVTFKIWNKDMENGVDTEMGVAEEAVTDKEGKITLKRLIPGTYCIQETKTVPGYVLNDEIYEITISKDGRVDGKDVGKITVKNVITKLLGTVAKDKDTGTQEAVPKKNTTFIDTVKFEDLQVGQEYIIKGKLMDKSTGKPLLVNGKEVTAEKKFKAEKANGTVDVEFVFDASGLKGKQIVVFEKVYIGDKEILSHEDINDKGQTITFKVGSLNPKLPGNRGGGLLTALKTGDTAALIPWVVLTLITAGIIIVIMVQVRRKKGSEGKDYEE